MMLRRMNVDGKITLDTLSMHIALSLLFFIISLGSFFLASFFLAASAFASPPFVPSDCAAVVFVPICWPLSAAHALFARRPADEDIVPRGIIEWSEGRISALPPPPELSKAKKGIRYTINQDFVMI